MFNSNALLDQFSLPERSLTRTPPGLQVNEEGAVFVSSGNQLLRLNGNLDLEQSVNLTSKVIRLSLTTEGNRLVVCSTDFSCSVYNASDLSAGPLIVYSSAIVGTDTVVLFTAPGTFYVGSISGSSVNDRINLQQHSAYGYGFSRSADYVISNNDGLKKTLYDGLVVGSNAYYFAVDSNPSRIRALRVMRVCHCPGNSNFSCRFMALYEEGFFCGGAIGRDNDNICGVTILEDFADSPGPVFIVARCREDSPSSNIICLINLTRIDNHMDMRYDSCSMGTARFDIEPAWGSETECNRDEVMHDLL